MIRGKLRNRGRGRGDMGNDDDMGDMDNGVRPATFTTFPGFTPSLHLRRIKMIMNAVDLSAQHLCTCHVF